MGRASKDKRDIYYRKAKEEGYRARSAYKLLQIHEELNILSEDEITTGAVDLCAAPGSWSQVLASHFKRIEATRQAKRHTDGDDAAGDEAAGAAFLKPRIVAVDLQEMAPIDGVTIMQGDITSEATANKIIELLNARDDEGDQDGCLGADCGGADCLPEVGARHEEKEAKKQRVETAAATTTTTTNSDAESVGKRQQRPLRKADIVVCDGAPDVTGMHELDEYLQHQLLLAALTITTCVLRPGGAFVTKMFRGPNTPFLVAKSELFFDQVRVVKPKSSRNASMESFLVCQGFRVPQGYVPRFLNAATNATSGSTDHNHQDAKAQTATTAAVGDCFTPEAPLYGYQTTTSTAACSGSGGQDDSLGLQQHLLPFLSCGDLSGFDADMCYNREEGSPVLAPVQPPLEAPYLTK